MMNELKRMILRPGLSRVFPGLNLALLAAGLALATPAGAALKFWSGLGANSTWTNAANWGGIIPGPGDDLVFQAGAARLVNTNTFAPGTVFNSITILGTNYVIYGNGLTLAGAVGLSAQHATGTNTFHPALTLNTALPIECTGAGATLILGANASINLNAHNLTLNAVGAVEVAGAISGTGSVIKNGAGKLTLDGPLSNSYLGTTVVNAGTVELFKVGFPLAATAIPGDLVVGNGLAVATVRNLTVLEIADTANITVNALATLDLNNNSENIAALNLVGGTVTTGSGTLTLGGDLTSLPADVTAKINGRLSLGGVTRIFNVGIGVPVPDLLINAIISDGGAGAGFTKTSPGWLRLTGSNTYSGLTTLADGNTYLSNNLALGASGAGTNGTLVGANARFELDSVLVTNEFLTLSNATVFAASGLSSWSGPIALEGNIMAQVFSGTLTNSGIISGGGGLTLSSGGTLVFSGSAANTYVGTTVVSNGLLQLRKSVGDGALRGPLVVGHASGAANSAVVQLSGGEQMYDYLPVTVNSSGWLDLNGIGEWFGSLAGSGSVTLGIGTPRIGFDNTSTTFGGVISGTGGLLLVGGGLNLTGANTYTGTTFIQSGTLLVNGSQPKSPVSLTGGVLGGSGTVGPISGAGGAVSPGSNPGSSILTCSNILSTGLTFYTFELRGPAAGTDYDQLNVRGTVNLTNAALNLLPNFLAPVALGDQFILINNDGIDPVAGIFSGYPAGTSLNLNGYKLAISYTGGDGNDVALTVTGVPASVLGATVVGGNGNGAIEAGECNLLYLSITNAAGGPLSAISATLSTLTPGVVITSMQSPYADLPAGGKGTNAIPFQLTTTPVFNCGGDISLILTVTTAGGSFVTSFTLPSGAVGAPLRFNNNNFTPIPDLGTVESTNVVSGLTTPIKKVTVSLYLAHSFDSDLTITLLAPDGTPVELSSNNGGGGDNYGADCADGNRTTFDDAAATPITAGGAPFVGTFRPEGTLATFAGKFGGAANGPWRLRLADGAGSDFGTLVCWSLFISPTVCSGGEGGCELCPNVVLAGALGLGSPVQSDRLSRNGQLSTCAVPTLCPGSAGNDGGNSYDAHVFRNGPSNACISVTLSAPGADLFSAAYLGGFDPNNLCLNYLADAGDSTIGISFGTGPRTYSFSVAANAVFVVTVNGVYGSTGAYQLSVTGGDCRPALDIRPALAGRVRVAWPTSAGGCLLQSTPIVAPASWTTVTNPPVVSGGRFAVTNSAGNATEFYRLLKP